MKFIFSVTSNDELYGHDPKFLAEVNNLCRIVIEEILRQLSVLGSGQHFKLQATLALELFLRIVRYADLSKEHTHQLALNLWLLATKHENHLEPKYMVSFKCTPSIQTYLITLLLPVFTATHFEIGRRTISTS